MTKKKSRRFQESAKYDFLFLPVSEVLQNPNAMILIKASLKNATVKKRSNPNRILILKESLSENGSSNARARELNMVTKFIMCVKIELADKLYHLG